MEFSRQAYWSGKPFPSPGNLPYPGIETGSPALQADSLLSEAPGKLNYDTNETKTMTKQKQTWENIENSLVIAKVRERWAGTFRLAGTNYIDRMDNNKVLLYSTGDYIQ